MIVVADTTFIEDLKKIKDKTIINRAERAVEKLHAADSLREVSNIKAMQGYPNHFRLRFGDYRIGFCLQNEETIELLAIDHRSKFYIHFPD